MKLYKYLIASSLLIIGSGLAVVAPIGMSWFEQREALASAPLVSPATATVAQTTSTTKTNVIEGIPRHITVPSLGIDANIADGYYDPHTGQWTLSEDSAYYATTSVPTNSDSGNTFIYGHNSQKIFGKLLNIQPGAEVTVTTDNGYAFTYVFQSTQAVSPTDVQILDYSGAPRLTLQTCSGLWHQTRQMLFFTLKEYHKV